MRDNDVWKKLGTDIVLNQFLDETLFFKGVELIQGH